MSQFYVSMIFIGIILVLVSLIWVIYDRNKGTDYTKKMEEKKEQLVGIINDAEQMINELNRFSDYVVTEVNARQEELMSSLKRFDQRVAELRAGDAGSGTAFQTDKSSLPARAEQGNPSVPSNPVNQAAQTNPAAQMNAASHAAPSFKSAHEAAAAQENQASSLSHSAQKNGLAPVKSRTRTRNTDNVINLNARNYEVIKLAKKGMSETEIARTLNIGKGEIELILQVENTSHEIMGKY